MPGLRTCIFTWYEWLSFRKMFGQLNCSLNIFFALFMNALSDGTGCMQRHNTIHYLFQCFMAGKEKEGTERTNFVHGSNVLLNVIKNEIISPSLLVIDPTAFTLVHLQSYRTHFCHLPTHLYVLICCWWKTVCIIHKYCPSSHYCNKKKKPAYFEGILCRLPSMLCDCL